MKQTILRKYARLIARCGVNIQKGQDVLIYCVLDQPKFVELLVDECYKAGARKVKVEFNHPLPCGGMGKGPAAALCGHPAL